MKKSLFIIIFIFLTIFEIVKAQSFQDFIHEFPEKTAPFTVSNTEISNSIQTLLDGETAWKYLWMENEFQSPAQTFCYPIARYMLNDKVLVLIYSQGEPNQSLFYTVQLMTYNLKKESMIDEFPAMFGTFKDDGSLVTKLEIKADGLVISNMFNKLLNNKDVLQVEIDKNGKMNYE